jgi:hypothetical protein
MSSNRAPFEKSPHQSILALLVLVFVPRFLFSIERFHDCVEVEYPLVRLCIKQYRIMPSSIRNFWHSAPDVTPYNFVLHVLMPEHLI